MGEAGGQYAATQSSRNCGSTSRAMNRSAKSGEAVLQRIPPLNLCQLRAEVLSLRFWG